MTLLVSSDIVQSLQFMPAVSQFLPRDAILARYKLLLCLSVCPSICLSVCHKPALYQKARQRSLEQRYTIAQSSSFLMPKISAKFQRGHQIEAM